MPPSKDSQLDVQRLLDASVYSHKVEDLRLLETHISWVVLTGQYAYKLKKPCKFSFVDYSTLELRRDFCYKEVELNRRLAADIYLDVVPIYSNSDGSLQVGSPSVSPSSTGPTKNAVEYAVKMRQFPQDAILTSRLDHHALSPESVDQLGRDLAAFHESIEQVSADLACVQPDRIRQDAIDNITLLQERLPADSEHQSTLTFLMQWTEQEFEDRRSSFQRRVRMGFVRRCHGDMHLNNLIQLDAHIKAFDCIEFNEEFQWVDVMSDIAFPVMDFMTHRRSDLGWRLLNSYLETRNDWSGLEVFRFYAVYRALVRAKVTWLDPSQHESSDATTDPCSHASKEASGPWVEYMRTAMELACPKRCQLSITHGFSGSGKSTRAWSRIAKFGGLRIRSDVERKRLRMQDNAQTIYTPQSRELIYEHLLELARRILGWKFDVVVDATFLKQATRAQFQALAEEMGASFRILHCEASFDELAERIARRKNDASDATQDVLRQQMHDAEALTEAEWKAVADD